MPRPLCAVRHMFRRFRTVCGRSLPPEGRCKMLTLFCETGTRGKERPTRMLHGSPDACTRIACRRMHREKKPWMSVGFRHDRAPRVLLPISLHLLATPCAQPGLFPRPPSLRQPWLQVSLVPLAWHHRRAAHRLPGTALKDPQTARCSMASSWRGAPRLHKVPVTRGRRRAWAGLGFTSQHRPSPPRVFLQSRHATPTASLPTHPLNAILG